MRIGTRSVLYGYHGILWHWITVALGWYSLYGFRKVTWNVQFRYGAIGINDTLTTSLLDWKLWLAFLVHDIGYIGKPNMDGDEGETHPEWGGKFMEWVTGDWAWYYFCVYHSRFYSKRANHAPSPLCFADKMAIVFLPNPFYLLVINLTGEVKEYMAKSDKLIAKGGYGRPTLASQRVWMRDVKDYVRRWVAEHKDGKDDTWTPSAGYGSDRPAEVVRL